MYGYGWWEKPTPVKTVNFNWDDDIPKIRKKRNAPVTTNQKRDFTGKMLVPGANLGIEADFR